MIADEAAPRWLAIRARPGLGRSEAVAAALFDLGSSGVQEDGGLLITQLPPGTDREAVRRALLDADHTADIHFAEAEPVDWSEKWRDRVRAHDLGAITVTPPWLAEGMDPARTVVVDPGMAFGTGEHATTRGVIRLLPRVLRDGDVVADLGAGSAVLSIAAVKLGAARVAAIESDGDAIENAEENVRRNGVAGRVTVIEGDATTLLPLVAPVRVVLANIISSVLLELLPAIRNALTPDGAAILSGILVEERDRMLLALGEWRVVAEDHEEGWWSVAVAKA